MKVFVYHEGESFLCAIIEFVTPTRFKALRAGDINIPRYPDEFLRRVERILADSTGGEKQ